MSTVWDTLGWTIALA